MFPVLHVLTLVMQLQAAQPQGPLAASLAPATVWAKIEHAEREFFSVWGEAWAESQRTNYDQFAESARDGGERNVALHCHWDELVYPFRRHIIRGQTNAHAACPRFLPPGVTAQRDERRHLDDAIAQPYLAHVHASRAILRRILDSLAVAFPRDMRITGQRIRFALDAGDARGAAQVAASCTQEAIECGLLQGLILYRVGNIAAADSAFLAASDAMPPDMHCLWNDVQLLLDGDARDQYEQMTCAARTEFEEKVWWLADPMWSEAGNERRAEHFARKVSLRLLEAFEDDGRQHFTPRRGGQAVEESLIRYGWPTQMIWGGRGADDGHTSWLRVRSAESAEPYLVREYSRALRLHTVPELHALAHPLEATRDDWQLSARDDYDWWPVEHFARDAGAITDLPEGQAVMLRRRDLTRIAWAGALDSSSRGKATDSTRHVTLLDSRAPGDMHNSAAAPIRRGIDAVVDAALPAGPALVSIEVAGDSMHAAARSRFAIDVAPPLTALGDARAVSQALLFEPMDNDGRSLRAEQAIAQMLANTNITGMSRVGVYWESYGFSPDDSVDIALRIIREERSGLLGRALHAVGIGSERVDSLTVQWREVPGNSRALQQMEGSTNVQMRSIVLDTSSLLRGKYRLVIAVSRPGERAATSARQFALQ